MLSSECIIIVAYFVSTCLDSLFIQKIQAEFDDLLSRALGRVVKQLTVSDTPYYYLPIL